MDKFNRLTRNDEWQVGARYRWTKVHESRLVRSVRRACEVTFLGWHHTGRRELVGHATLLYADGSKVVFSPVCWRNRWVLIAPNPEPLPPIEDLAQLLAGNAPGEPSGCPGVVIDAARHTVTLHYDGAYEIDLDTIPDEAALLRWLLHLCEKNWMDTARLHEVATAIGTYKGFRLSGLL